MATVREIKTRIKSVKEIRQITNAMKLVSASRLKRAKQQLEQTLPYFKKVRDTMADILMHSANQDNLENVFFDMRKDKEGRKTGFIILSGDKGLAGGYNHNILKLAEEKLAETPNHIVFAAGNMGRNYLARKNYSMHADFFYPVQNPTIVRAQEISSMVLDLFTSGEIDELHLVYTHMISALTLQPRSIQLLPMDLNTLMDELGMNNKENGQREIKPDDLFDYEPSPKAVFDVLIPKYIEGVLYGALVEAYTSEQSARMNAMDNATSNADDILTSLSLHYNRARQAAITQEISEIVGGAAALQ